MAARREPLSTIDLGLAGQRKISQFKAIHPIITGPVSTSNSQKLEFYSLFKQSTIGDVNTERPGIFSIIERKKWDSWKALEGTSKEDAKQRYIDVLLDMFDKIAEELDMDLWLNKECDPCIKTNLALLGKSHN